MVLSFGLPRSGDHVREFMHIPERAAIDDGHRSSNLFVKACNWEPHDAGIPARFSLFEGAKANTAECNAAVGTAFGTALEAVRN